MSHSIPNQAILKQDDDTQETREWLEALESVIKAEGVDRAHYIIEQLLDTLRRSGADAAYSPNTAYVNTIPTHMQPPIPGDAAMERRIRSIVRWNAAAMVSSNCSII